MATGNIATPAQQPTTPVAAQPPLSDKPITNDYDGTTENVVGSYPWTISKIKNRNDIPRIVLYEHRNTEPTIKRQMLFYGLGLASQGSTEAKNLLAKLPMVGGMFSGLSEMSSNAANSALEYAGVKAKTTGGMLDVYREIFPDSTTYNRYIFPYFTKTYLELTSSRWEQMDDIGDSIDKMAGGAGQAIEEAGKLIGMDKTASAIAGGIDLARGGLKAGAEISKTYLRGQYPIVGIFDRPRIFSSHSERDVTIEFPLYNTIHPDHWAKNRKLIHKMMTQFLYIKQSYITGIPPVFYRVLVPGQYYSFASCVTNFKVENLGNIRLIEGINVPDAYQISLTLSELCMPSLNQFQAMESGEALNYVEAR